jgi:WhiB family transcriptional regulator, redox-sensing transcriptional regulator
MGMKTHSRGWRDLAACRRANPELFFPVTEAGPGHLQVARAKAVCAGCRVRQDCLDFAMSTHQVHGVWGGFSEADRRRLRADLLADQIGQAS